MSSKERNFNCRICQAVSPTDGTMCLGCGTPLRNAINRNKQHRVRPHLCPECHSNNYRVLEPDRFCCTKCNSVFEPDDMGYLDDRPLMNAIKREQE